MYRENEVYIVLEELIKSAGVTVRYENVPDDSIDGAIWARSDTDLNSIMMPDDPDSFPDEETACKILGHEMGHILAGLDSPDEPAERENNEATCDLVGHCLYKLAEMIVEAKAEKRLRDAAQR